MSACYSSPTNPPAHYNSFQKEKANLFFSPVGPLVQFQMPYKIKNKRSLPFNIQTVCFDLWSLSHPSLSHLLLPSAASPLINANSTLRFLLKHTKKGFFFLPLHIFSIISKHLSKPTHSFCRTAIPKNHCKNTHVQKWPIAINDWALKIEFVFIRGK